MKRLSGPRQTINLPEPVQQRLNMYASAAAAAGVGILTLTPPAQAKIVYTPAHIRIVGNVDIDLNHDGIVDFTIQFRAYNRLIKPPTGHEWSSVYSHSRNRVWGNSLSASALPDGAQIESNALKFVKGQNCGYGTHRGTCKVMEQCDDTSGYVYCHGPWAVLQSPKGEYLGFKFYINGKTHFGWARLEREQFRLVLTGYAYETIPGKSIIAGKTNGQDDDSIGGPNASLGAPSAEPPTLGMLALGAPALSIWRRE